MNKTTLTLRLSIIFLFLNFSTFAQPTWEKIFSKKSGDVFRSVIEVPSGGFMIAGATADSTVNDSDAYAVRMTTAGDTLWTRSINGSNSRKDLFYKVINTDDGGFAFCGYSTNATVANDDAFFLKMDGAGTIQWSNYWGGAGKDRAQDIVQTADGGYAVTGYTTSPPSAYYDAFILRLNSSGDTLWSKYYGGGGFEDANTITLLPDDGFIIGGQGTNGSSGLDMFLVRTDKLGDTLWTKKFGSSGTDNIENLIRLTDGSFIITGGTDDTSGFGGNDGILVKTDTGGVVLWTKYYGGNSQDDFHQVSPTADGGFILSGTSRSSGALEPNMWLVKTNSAGDSTWTQTYGGNNHDHGYGAVQTLDGGYIFVGYTGSFGFNGEEAYVVKTNELGEIGNYLTYTSVSALTRPLSENCASNNVQVRVVVRNYGRDTVPSVPVTIQISGPINQTLNQTYVGNVYPGDLDTLAFSTLIDMSTPGVYSFNCTSAVVNDVFPQNNFLPASAVVYSNPTVNIGPDTVVINVGQSITLDAGSGFTFYSWSTGATTQTISVSSTSNISVTVTNSNNCSATDSIYVNVTVGIEDILNPGSLVIYPNPTSDKFNLKVERISLKSEIRILDILGSEIYSGSVSEQNSFQTTVDLSSSPKGIYFVQLHNASGTVTKRIVLQ